VQVQDFESLSFALESTLQMKSELQGAANVPDRLGIAVQLRKRTALVESQKDKLKAKRAKGYAAVLLRVG
jgi:hypothetical protein